MKKLVTAAILAGFASVSLAACGGGKASKTELVADVAGGVSPYLWRASLDTLSFMPLVSADPVGGVVIYDWKSYSDLPDERMKATVFILDSRLRADGVSVVVFRQTRVDGEWQDAPVDPDTAPQLENQILTRARQLRVSEID